MDVADIVRIEVGEGQRLQVIKARILQISPYKQLHLADEIAADKVGEHLRQQYQKIQGKEGGQRLQTSLPDVTIQRIAVEQRVDRVAETAPESQQHHPCDFPAVGARIGQDFSQPEETERLSIPVLFHFYRSSLCSDESIP